MTRNFWSPNSYPPTRRSDHVDIYKSEAKGEVRVADPYQWLEEYTDETDRWTSTQEKFTRAYLDQNPDRQKLEDVFRSSTDFAKVVEPLQSVEIIADHRNWLWLVLTTDVARRWSLVLVS